MNTLERTQLRKWHSNFEDALKGWKKKLELIAPIHVDPAPIFKEIMDAQNAARRDVYARNVRVGFDESNHAPIEVHDDLLPDPKVHKSTSTYSEADFRQSDATDMEGVYLDTLLAQRRAKRPFLTPTELVPGNRVVIWIKDHFYENQTAIVVGYREVTNEYLVEIVTKRPYKRGHSVAPGAKALMYVKLQEVKLCRRGNV
jgi:hypothetical protein